MRSTLRTESMAAIFHSQLLLNFVSSDLISAGIDNGIQYIFTLNALVSEVLSEAEFIEADITFNETKEYPYLFNVVAFNDNNGVDCGK